MNLLIGNGINIQFGGEAYQNSTILKRIEHNLKIGRYKDLFGGILTEDDLCSMSIMLTSLFDDVVNGEYDRYCRNNIETRLLSEIKFLYSTSNSKNTFIDVGMEFYYFALRLFHYRFNDGKEIMKNVFFGISQLLLDGIYNNGKIEAIYESMSDILPLLSSAEKIFTVNYDTNLDSLIGEKVMHLHGSFTVLHPEHDVTTLHGYDKLRRGILVEPLRGYKHTYCNAVFGFSGDTKKEIIEKYYNENISVSKLLNIYNSKDTLGKKEFLAEIETKNNSAYSVLLMLIKKPDLKIPHYQWDELHNSKGELWILGLSPYNDSHIFEAINESNILL